MGDEYLLKEYELCFEQLRFYDTRQENLLKYLCTLTSAVATALLALFQLTHGATADFLRLAAIVAGLVFIASILLFLAMLQNRLYFVYVARQINAIRAHLMEVSADGFKKNQMYTSTRFPALKLMSVHTLQIVGAALISSLFAGGCAYGVVSPGRCGFALFIATEVFLGAFVVEAVSGVAYLLIQGKKTADTAIHGESKSA